MQKNMRLQAFAMLTIVLLVLLSYSKPIKEYFMLTSTVTTEMVSKKHF